MKATKYHFHCSTKTTKLFLKKITSSSSLFDGHFWLDLETTKTETYQRRTVSTSFKNHHKYHFKTVTETVANVNKIHLPGRILFLLQIYTCIEK